MPLIPLLPQNKEAHRGSPPPSRSVFGFVLGALQLSDAFPPVRRQTHSACGLLSMTTTTERFSPNVSRQIHPLASPWKCGVEYSLKRTNKTLKELEDRRGWTLRLTRAADSHRSALVNHLEANAPKNWLTVNYLDSYQRDHVWGSKKVVGGAGFNKSVQPVFLWCCFLLKKLYYSFISSHDDFPEKLWSCLVAWTWKTSIAWQWHKRWYLP